MIPIARVPVWLIGTLIIEIEKMQKSIAVDSEIVGSFISGGFRGMQIHTGSEKDTIELLPNRQSLPKRHSVV